jgi:hypothetical protein
MNRTYLLPWLALLAGACSSEAPPAPTPSPAAARADARAPARAAAPAPEPGRRGFDRMTPGTAPEGWPVAGTGPAGEPATWSVVADAKASSPPNVFALTSSTHGSSSTFNLCWDASSSFIDGILEVALRADGGTEDQGGGPVWRLKDADNYYVCRANPLEKNFRLYVVANGERKQLASAEAELTAGTWHKIRVEHSGPRIVCTLDDTVRLEATDTTLPDAGCVGLWTKADARTSFDDLTVQSIR